MKTEKGKLTLCESGFIFDQKGEKICAKGLGIKTIDKMVQKARETKILDLSNNQLCHLDNIAQFLQLREIDISHNHIKQGSELLKLKKLTKLQKISVKNNPLLEEPLSEELLNFLTLKQTDLGLLNNSAGQRPSQSLRSPVKSQRASANPFENSPNTVSKRHSSAIRKSERGQLESSMRIKRIIQQGRMNSLIEGVRELVGDEEFVKQEESMQEQGSEYIRQSQFEQVNSRWMFSPQKKNKGSQHLSAKFIAHARESPPSSHNYHIFEQQDAHMQRSSRPAQKTGEQQQVHREKAVNYFSFSTKNDLATIPPPQVSAPQPKGTTQSQSVRLKDKRESLKGISCISHANIKEEDQMGGSQQTGMNQRKLDHQSSSWPKEVVELNVQSLDDSLSQCLTHEQYQMMYNHNLNKYDPTFNLLYSDFGSLESEEKHILISALQKDHRQKTIGYLKEKEKNKIMREYLESLSLWYRQERHQALQAFKAAEYQNALSQQSFANQRKENLRLTELIGILGGDLQVLKEQIRHLHQSLSQKEDDIEQLHSLISQQADMEQQYKQEVHQQKQKAERYRQELEQQTQKAGQYKQEVDQQKQKAEQAKQKVERETEIEELLVHQRRQRIKKQQFQLLLQKAKRQHKINLFREKQKLKLNRLMELSWTLLKRYSFTSVLVKMKWEDKLETVRKNCFKAWSRHVLRNKCIKEMSGVFKSRLKTQSFQRFLEATNKGYKQKQQAKLSKYWADRHYTQIIFFKFKQNTEAAQRSRKNHDEQADTHRILQLKKKLLKMLTFVKAQNIQTSGLLSRKLDEASISKFYLRLRKYRKNTQLRKVQEQRVQELSTLIGIKNHQKVKKQVIRRILARVSQQGRAISRVKAMRLLISLHVLRQLASRSRIVEEKTVKCIQIRRKKFFKGFRNRFSVICRQYAQLQTRAFQAIRCHRKKVMLTCFKQMRVEKWLHISRQKHFYVSFVRKFHEAKLYIREVEHCKQLQQAEQIIQKMKGLEELELSAITHSYAKQIQILNLQISSLQQELQTDWANKEDLFRQKQQQVKLLQNELRACSQKEGIYHQEHQLMLQEIQLKNEEIKENQNKIGRLGEQVMGLSLKYDKMLGMYSKMDFLQENKPRTALSSNKLLVEYTSAYENSDKARRNNQERRDKTLQKRMSYESSDRDFNSNKTYYH